VRGNWVRSRVLDIALKSKHTDAEKYFINLFLNILIESLSKVWNGSTFYRAFNPRDSFWDRVVFNTVKQSLGGNLKLLISGASQISPTVLNFMRSSFGCLVSNSFCTFTITKTFHYLFISSVLCILFCIVPYSVFYSQFCYQILYCLNEKVIEGYGLTESSSFVTLTHCGDQSTGTSFINNII
jgi:long-subunit acyl-CoA synthetase (AMP-forming)